MNQVGIELVSAVSNTIHAPFVVFFFNDTATTEIYTLSLHDALPICCAAPGAMRCACRALPSMPASPCCRSEEHTSELQSHLNLVCRLLLEKKKTEESDNLGTHVRTRIVSAPSPAIWSRCTISPPPWF